jgi:hypothetical protein
MKLTEENRSTRGKTCPSATLSTKNPKWTDTGSSPGFCGEKPATNRLSHGTASEPDYQLQCLCPSLELKFLPKARTTKLITITKTPLT